MCYACGSSLFTGDVDDEITCCDVFDVVLKKGPVHEPTCHPTNQ